MIDLDKYLSTFDYGKTISNPELWCEMDKVWDTFSLNNRLPFSNQDIGSFYSHPVWILNGLFSENDINSFEHRKRIAEFARNYFQKTEFLKIADFGGGSGVLAKILENDLPNLDKMHIVEPWPSEYFLTKLNSYKKIQFVSNFENINYYDLIIAQDVLEHVENPIQIAFKCFEATNINGLLIFANCFQPHIKCHLPRNFYLRHMFRYVVTSSSLIYIGRLPGAYHMEVYQKKDSTALTKFILFKNLIAKITGPIVNFVFIFLLKIKNIFK